MLNRNEIVAILVAALVISFAVTLIGSIKTFLIVFVFMLVIILINTFAKKIVASSLESRVEVKLWEIRQYGFKPESRLKKAFPLGVFLPIVSKIIFFPFYAFVWMGSLIFDVEAKIYRAAKRHGLYSFSEMTEEHIGYIAAAGIVLNLIFAIIAYLVGLPLFARLSIFYVFFNMLPISNLDGNKMFFGTFVLWSFLAIITLIGMAYTFLIP